MDKELRSLLGEAFNDAYCDNGKIGVAKLYAAIQIETDRLLTIYLESELEEEEE